MIFNKKWNTRLAVFSVFTGLMILLPLWDRSPALAQEGFGFVTFVDRQILEVRNGTGEIIGTGTFRANVSSNRTGRTNGKAELQMPDFALELEFSGVDEILYEDTTPVGVVLSGRGTLLRAGQTETFPATATVRGGGTTTIPDCLIWDIPGAPVIEGLNFEAEGRLRFRER